MASLSPRTIAASGGSRLWWAGYVPVAVVLLATVALIALGQFLGWGAALTQAFTAAPPETVANPLPALTPALPSTAELQRERGDLLVEIARLREELTALSQGQAAAQNFGAEAEALQLIEAPVLYKDPYKVLPRLIIGAGSADGLKRGQPVLGTAGVIGRVSAVWPNRARVDFLGSPGVAFGGIIQSSRTLGVLETDGERLLLDYVAKSTSVSSGDFIVTSGVPGLTPQGLPLGYVDSVVKATDQLMLTIEVRPLEDPWLLESVRVVRSTEAPLEEAPSADPSAGGRRGGG